MKWKNKGHEFDEVYKSMISKKQFYLFGAGDYGRQFLQAFQTEIKIIGFIDNDSNKQNTLIGGVKCFSFENAKCNNDTGIIITMSQIARVNPIQQLEQAGLRKNIEYFIIEEFISIYNVYRFDKVYFSSISFLPSTACNLNCRYCLNFNPFAKKSFSREIKELKKDVDLFFQCIDHIMLFHVSGGEPLIYRYTADIIEYIDKNYGNKIDTLRTVTNGTIVPTDDVLEKLSKCNVEITVDDYRDAVPKYKDNFEILINKLNNYQIKYYINKVDSWIDLAPEKTDYSMYSEDEMIYHRDNCSQSWQELRDGKLYSCNYAAYATVAGIAGEEDSEEVYDLKLFTSNKKKELIEFRLGYMNKGYTNFCRKCRGFVPQNIEEKKPAIQIGGNDIVF